MATFFRSLLLGLTLMGLGQFVFAAEYYWQGGGFTGSSPAAVCSQWIASVKDEKYVNDEVKPESGTQFSCIYHYRSVYTYNTSILVQRYGDTCTGSYSASTGICTPPPDDCSSTAGQENFNLSGAGPRSNFPPGAPVSPLNTRMCDNKCAYTYSGGGSTRCGSLKGGDTTQLYCIFTYTGTGQACVDGDEPSNSAAPPNPDPPADPNDPTDPRNNCGPGRVWSGTTCVSYFDPDVDPGAPGDGGTNPGTPGDGSGGGGGGGGGNGGGDGGGNGNGGGSGNGDGGGTGGGGGGGGDGDGDGEGGGLESGLEQKKQGDFEEAYAEWDEKIADLKALLDQKSGELMGSFKGVFDLNLGSGSGSLPCDPLTIKIGKASASSNACIADYGDQLVWLRYMILLIAAIAAAFIVLRN